MAMFGPVSLLTLLATWLLLIIAGYTAMYLGRRRALAEHGPRAVRVVRLHPRDHAIPTSGRPLLDLHRGRRSGLLLVTLLITYLPTIYGAFSRRESGGRPCSRCGPGTRPVGDQHAHPLPPHRGGPYRLAELWRQWEDWFADIEEIHTSFPDPGLLPLARSRTARGSPRPAPCSTAPASGRRRSSIPRTPTSSCASGPATWPCAASPTSSGCPTTPIPQPDDPISISRYECDEAWQEWGRPASRSRTTARRRGRPSGAGGSTTTPCCSTWPAWSRPRGALGVGPQPDQPASGASASGDPPPAAEDQPV